LKIGLIYFSCSICSLCIIRCTAGARINPILVIKTTPLNNAYIDENHLPAFVVIFTTGPMPLRIIDALCKESSHGISAV
jgi:heterodisulfide reductase subunit C